ncbi:MAG TPA: glutamate--tRNA ligase [Marinilabiliales bacterium]|nr:MAG: glutamate--tRNA ligase [Bacteroidetes bacterium GWA2_40_14]OFX59882.1 MAG: glutamate--tRNA ligase [Bacteroidetes bacterium GWC2_40_13]OFX75105.1 MAG: glutamate--tRNA ligase [Bacteroidetes bacterium GWD2_40_43]OFX93846.1 MAG: glutamate--tRNA ligase [Bacteroidetes bacterium GWE2_40_63]OFY18081.1 MAG: glutamate--tRNA ligase [Bacteroidetes bacterium GWF2_40_13]OFZ27307.1 MAG: glutamate--tRNA ligase [Bacteroidetes bacterium RIFOXYC2_FULL_40_12]HAM98991.1 glutamate--tRNA ligase [Marinilabil
MSERRVRVRFAPSPTGPLHMGGVRTALFNYLFAKKHGGDFLLRIEDTDQTRFVPGAEEYIMESLEWCGIKVDEGIREGGNYGPYRQSERREIYKKYADQLIASGNAYYAFDSPKELDVLRKEAEEIKETFTYNAATRGQLKNSLTLSSTEVEKHLLSGNAYVIRFKMPINHEVVMQDIIRGEVRVNTDTLDDKVLFKSDGLPTYHLANIVDDHLMEITHVIRGEEWLPSLPLHVLLYQSFGWETTMPKFSHLPLLLKPTGNGKLSKRDGDKMGFPVFPLFWKSEEGETAMGYREEGYFPDAFVNLLALLGWNPGTEQEIFTMDELIQLFSLERVTKSGSKFDPKKAEWFNHQYMLMKSNAELVQLYLPILKQKGIETSPAKVERIVGLIKDRTRFVKEFWEQSSFFFEAPTSYDPEIIKKRWKEGIPGQLTSVKDVMAHVTDFNGINAKAAVSACIEGNGWNFGSIINTLRLCLVGASKGPDLFEIMEIIGKEETIQRIDTAVRTIK